MARSKEFLRTRDIDWALEVAGKYIHVASAGGDLPMIVEEHLFEIWGEIKKADIVCEENDVVLNEKYLNEKYPKMTDEGPVAGNMRMEWYVHTFKAMAMRGFYSFDRDISTPVDDSKYRLVAKPGKLFKEMPKLELPKVNLEKTPEDLDGMDIVKVING